MRVISAITLATFGVLMSAITIAQRPQSIGNWNMQDSAKVPDSATAVSSLSFKMDTWYSAVVPGTVLTTLVLNKVYPEPLYGENMRNIPESLNKTSYWYRSTFVVPASYKERHVWLHFGGINYSAEIWVNGSKCGTMRGAFIRGDFDITAFVKPGGTAALAVLVSPQPHPGVPHEHNVANGIGHNGGETALDGPTFLSTIGWDWLVAIRDRNTGIWLPVTLDSTGPVIVKNPYVITDLAADHSFADLKISTTLENKDSKPITGEVAGTVTGQDSEITFHKIVTLAANGSTIVSISPQDFPALRVSHPKLWWPNGYGQQNLSHLKVTFKTGPTISDEQVVQFGIRKIEYEVADSENLTLSVNGVSIMARGGNWGLDEGMKRIPRKRLEAQFHMHALANLNIIRNWVGQSTSPDFYDLADKYGILLWDEFFQPNPGDGPDVTDIPTYIANVTDKVLRYRNHPSIAVWCARNEGYPPKELDETLKTLMGKIDPPRHYQSNSADGHGVSSHGPYYWRAPNFYYILTESFKTETGSMSIPTMESIQGMMPQKDWETINDDWAQHDMARGAQRGDEFPLMLAQRYGHIRNLADFARKGAMATYESYRAMYEGRNAKMFKETTGVITWMSNPAQPSFVWQLYHYDLEPNAALYAAKKAAETIHIQLNEENYNIEVVNNKPETLHGLKAEVVFYKNDSSVVNRKDYDVKDAPPSSTLRIAQGEPVGWGTSLYFVKLNLRDANGKLLSSNFYWKNSVQEDFCGLERMPLAKLNATATFHKDADKMYIDVALTNNTKIIALQTHIQLHKKKSGQRVLPVFYSDNYFTLVPGESRKVSIEISASNIDNDEPLLLLDGYNIDVAPIDGPVSVALNLNAQPSHWPATDIVPDRQ